MSRATATSQGVVVVVVVAVSVSLVAPILIPTIAATESTADHAGPTSDHAEPTADHAEPTPNQSEPTRIDSCTTIDEQGQYALTGDIENASAGQCLQIRANDVVLDGQGHLVDGQGSFGTAGVVAGRWAAGVSNVTVRNLTVSDWDDGVRLTEANGGVVADVTATRNRIGVLLRNASENRLSKIRAVDNAVHGVSVTDDSDGNQLQNVTATENSLFGVHLAGDASATVVRNVTASDNEYGVVLVGVSDNRVVGGEVTENRIAGVWLSASDGNRVEELTLSNRFYGVFVTDRSANNTIQNNVAEENAVGFRLRNADGNRLAENVASDGRDGILLIESDRNRVVENRVTGNLRGVSLFASSDNRFRENVVRENRRNFFVARGSENNSVPGESLST